MPPLTATKAACKRPNLAGHSSRAGLRSWRATETLFTAPQRHTAQHQARKALSFCFHSTFFSTCVNQNVQQPFSPCPEGRQLFMAPGPPSRLGRLMTEPPGLAGSPQRVGSCGQPGFCLGTN